MNVLSLFDGMSCGQIALKEINIKVSNYYASEICKDAIKTTLYNFPNTKQLGSVTDLINVDWGKSKIDLLIGGSPCQNFSFAGKQKGMTTIDNIEVLTLEQYLGLKKSNFEFIGQSYLFWEYVRILKEIQESNKDVLFLLENVKMSKKWQNIITETLGVEPIYINSSLVSAQNRPRLYWTNIKSVKEPKNNSIYFKDILEDLPFRNIIPSFYKTWGNTQRINKSVNHILKDKSVCLTTKLCHTSQYLFNEDFTQMRMLSINEARKLQTIPDYIYFPVSKTKTEKMLGNGWTIDVIKHILSFIN